MRLLECTATIMPFQAMSILMSKATITVQILPPISIMRNIHLFLTRVALIKSLTNAAMRYAFLLFSMCPGMVSRFVSKAPGI